MSGGRSTREPPTVGPPVVGIVARNSAHVELPHGLASRNFAIRRRMARSKLRGTATSVSPNVSSSSR